MAYKNADFYLQLPVNIILLSNCEGFVNQRFLKAIAYGKLSAV